MSSFSCKKLIGALVKTKQGIELGKVVDISLDELSYRLYSISVRPSGFISRLSLKNLEISSDQIVEILPGRIIVEDAVSKGGGNRLAIDETSRILKTSENPTMSLRD